MSNQQVGGYGNHLPPPTNDPIDSHLPMFRLLNILSSDLSILSFSVNNATTVKTLQRISTSKQNTALFKTDNQQGPAV